MLSFQSKKIAQSDLNLQTIYSFASLYGTRLEFKRKFKKQAVYENELNWGIGVSVYYALLKGSGQKGSC